MLARKLDVVGLRRKKEIRFMDSQKPFVASLKHGRIIKHYRKRRRGVNPRKGWKRYTMTQGWAGVPKPRPEETGILPQVSQRVSRVSMLLALEL